MLGQSLDPNQFLGPTGVTLLALTLLFVLARAVVWLMNKLLAASEDRIEEMRKDRDTWRELAVKGLSAAETSTDIAKRVVADDLAAEVKRLQADVARLKRRGAG